MDIAITVVHVIACFFLIIVVLLQTGKGADIGAVFGGSSQTVFGSGGAANLLTRLTTYTAVIFMITSLFLTWASTRSLTISVADDVPFEPPPLAAPVAEPAAPATASDNTDTAAADTAAATADDAAGAPAPAEDTASDPATGEKPAGAAEVGEEKQEAAKAIAEDDGAALEAGGAGSVEAVEEQVKKEDGAEAQQPNAPAE